MIGHCDRIKVTRRSIIGEEKSRFNIFYLQRYVVSVNSGKKQSLEEMLVAKLHILQELH
ncbi:hypothetical protein HanPI659440_Chr15g0610941 [Helianthus annuus]|nr:hypothetical protein HanPI659440_Chr15g0610941 [Helianthus annuus]